MNAKPQPVSYEDARQQAFATAYTVRIFGVPLGGKDSESHLAIWWCGIAANGLEHRQVTRRIWHLPKAHIVASGEANNFEVSGQSIWFFDVDRESDPIEETYSPVSLSHTLRLYFGAFLEDAPLQALAARAQQEPVPVTISPSPTTSPTGTPPITIQPLAR
jgi:hypothetical protein